MQAIALDEFDVRLLNALQHNSRLTHSELADCVFLSASQCQRRIKRLEDLGVIEQYMTRLSRDKTGLGVVAIIHVSIEKQGKFPAHCAGTGIPLQAAGGSASGRGLGCWPI